MIRKVILLVLSVMILAVSANVAAAADTVGVVESQKILFQHPDFDEVTRMLLYLGRPLAQNQMEIADRQEDENTRMMLRKYGELLLEFIGLDREIAAENDMDKKNALVEARRERLNQTELRLMDVIHRECQEAMQTVMTEKKITAVLEFDAVYYGGTNITEDVVRRLRTN